MTPRTPLTNRGRLIDEGLQHALYLGNLDSPRDWGRAFGSLGLDWRQYVHIDPRYYRPAEVEALRGDVTKARTQLGWEPRVDIDELVRRMIAHDLELARQERTLGEAGHAFATRGMAGA